MTDIPATLTSTNEFPDPNLALEQPNGLLAIGGDLSTERLIKAYECGIFPWFSANEPIMWWSPDPRATLDLDDFKITRSLKKTIKKAQFAVLIDDHFETVINACQKRNPQLETEETWITPEMKLAYIKLFEQGYAHSVACFEGNEFVGGLYGVSLGNIFFGESMVSLDRKSVV